MHHHDSQAHQTRLEEIKQQVIALLTKHHIPFENWGKGSAKTLEHLIKEVAEGETTLEEEPSGLVRKLAITTVTVRYTDPSGKKWMLAEEKQVFKDGRERRRNLGGSLAEKLKASEKPDQQTVNRAIQEELGIEGMVPAVATGSREEERDSPSYPGLMMKMTNHLFDAELNDAQFKPEGYVEHQTDKDNFFVWREE